MRKYRPSNGTEGMGFTEHFCDRCINQHPDPNNPKQCMILCKTMIYDLKDKEYPEEWTYDENGRPTCTAWKKWDWGRDDDGNWMEPPEPPTDDPNQLCFPFLFDELNIKQHGREYATT
jgi:hypothetical protein